MNLKDPILAFTGEGILETQAVVLWLTSNGVPAYAVEDLSGASLLGSGTFTPFHHPQVYIDRADAEIATKLLLQFEATKASRRQDIYFAPPITSTCEECGTASEFPEPLNGTIQNCPQCNAYMDVGTMHWPYENDPDEEEPPTSEI